jgi:hypothetical protein
VLITPYLIFSFDIFSNPKAQVNQYEGNIRFRELVQQRKDEYSATTNRRMKDTIAREIVEIVLSKEGRFLKKYEEIENMGSTLTTNENHSLIAACQNEIKEANNIKSPAKLQKKVSSTLAIEDETWVIVDKEIAVEKSKQALRDQEERKSREERNSRNDILLLELTKRIPVPSTPSELPMSLDVDAALQQRSCGENQLPLMNNRRATDSMSVKFPTVSKLEKLNGVSDGDKSECTPSLKPSSRLSQHVSNIPLSGTSFCHFRDQDQVNSEDKVKRLKSSVAGTAVSRLRKQQLCKLQVPDGDSNKKSSNEPDNNQSDLSRVTTHNDHCLSGAQTQHQSDRIGESDSGLLDRPVLRQRDQFLQNTNVGAVSNQVASIFSNRHEAKLSVGQPSRQYDGQAEGRYHNEGSFTLPTVSLESNACIGQEQHVSGAYYDPSIGSDSMHLTQLMLNAAVSGRNDPVSALTNGSLRGSLLSGATSPIILTQSYIELLSRSGISLSTFGYQDRQIPNTSALESYLLRQAITAEVERRCNGLRSLATAAPVAMSNSNKNILQQSNPVAAAVLLRYRLMNESNRRHQVDPSLLPGNLPILSTQLHESKEKK